MQFNPNRQAPAVASLPPPVSQDPTSIIPGADTAPTKPCAGVGLDAPTPEQFAAQLKQQEDDAAAQAAAQAAVAAPARAAADKAMEKTAEYEILHVIQSHRDLLPKNMNQKDIERIANDPKTPPDMKDAMTKLATNMPLQKRMDNARGGDRDGNIYSKDIDMCAEDPAFKKFCKEKSKAATKNYVPSDDPTQAPRLMTGADAFRELYLYAESLPDGLDREELEDLASGKSKGKRPIQLMAAAQFLLDNPEALKKILPPGGKLSNDEMEDTLVKHINLNPAEQKALETMKKNPDDFFKDGKKPVRSDLEKIASDTTKSPETREAAQLLLDDPVIFGMLDNAKGHGGNLVKKGNDGAISKEDLYKVANNLNSENKAAPAKPVLSAAPATAADAQILQEMANGAADDPNIKKASGGGLVDFAKGALKVLSMVMEVAKGIADGITGLLPGPLKFIGAAISGGIAVVNDMGIKPGLAMLDGKTAEEAYIEGAKDLAMDAVATVASAVIPGGGAIVAAEAGVKAGATAGAKAAAEAGSKAAATSATRAGATAGAEAGAESATSAAVKEGVKTGVKDQATGAVQDKAVEAAMA